MLLFSWHELGGFNTWNFSLGMSVKITKWFKCVKWILSYSNLKPLYEFAKFALNICFLLLMSFTDTYHLLDNFRRGFGSVTSLAGMVFISSSHSMMSLETGSHFFLLSNIHGWCLSKSKYPIRKIIISQNNVLGGRYSCISVIVLLNKMSVQIIVFGVTRNINTDNT